MKLLKAWSNFTANRISSFYQSSLWVQIPIIIKEIGGINDWCNNTFWFRSLPLKQKKTPTSVQTSDWNKTETECWMFILMDESVHLFYVQVLDWQDTSHPQTRSCKPVTDQMSHRTKFVTWCPDWACLMFLQVGMRRVRCFCKCSPLCVLVDGVHKL